MTRRNDPLIWLGVIVMVVLCFATSTCHGQPLDTSGWRASAVSLCQAEAHPAVGRIRAAAMGRSRTYGSGTLIDKNAERGIVVTCSHLFRDGPNSITVTFSDGKRYTAELLGRDRAWDLAVLKIAPPDATPVPIAANHSQPGDQLQSCGYGSDGRYWCNQGRVLGYVRTTLTQTYETLELSGRARDGDSGGPVFNASGELVAVLWGTDGRMVGGTYCGRIRKFLDEVALGIFGSRPQGGGAVGGLCPRCRNPNCENSQQPDCHDDGSCPRPGGGNQLLPGAIPIPKPGQPKAPGGIFPFKPLVPASPKQPEAKEPATPIPGHAGAVVIDALAVDVKELQALAEVILAELTKQPRVVPATPPAPKVPEPASPIVGPEPAIVTNPPVEKQKSGIPWATLLGLAAYVGTGVVGGGLPVWAVMAYRAARLAKQLRSRRYEAVKVVSEQPLWSPAPPTTAAPAPPAVAPAPPAVAPVQSARAPPAPPAEPTYDINYHPQPIDPGLLRMRKAMQLTSDEYPAAMTWVKRFEKVFSLLQSGEIT